MAVNNRRKMLMQKRRKLKPVRYQTAEYLAPNLVRYTCTTCGAKDEGPVDKSYRGNMSEEATRRMVRWWNSNNGCRGHCKRCTEKVRNELYPLNAGASHGA